MKLPGNVDNGSANRFLNFGGDPYHYLDQGIFNRGFFNVALISNIGGVGPWLRSALFEYSC